MLKTGTILVAKSNQKHMKGFTIQILGYNHRKTRYFIKIIDGLNLYKKGKEITLGKETIHKKWRRKNNYIKRLE